MSLIDVVVRLILLGVGLYLIGLIPMDGTVRQVIRIVVIVALVLWFVEAFGLLDFPQLRLRR